jgi:hypothetical protein
MTTDIEHRIVTASAARPMPAAQAATRVILLGDGRCYREMLAKLSKQGLPIRTLGDGVSICEPSAATGLADILRQVAAPSKAPDQPQPQSETPLICGRLRLHPATARAFWNDMDVDLTLGEYKIVLLLASNAGKHKTYRAIYDRLRHEGFIAGDGAEGYKANVRSAIKRIRTKFRAIDRDFDEIENYPSFGYCWKAAA